MKGNEGQKDEAEREREEVPVTTAHGETGKREIDELVIHASSVATGDQRHKKRVTGTTDISERVTLTPT